MFKELRKLILEYSYKSKIGHISSHLSICDLIWCLYNFVLKNSPSDYKNNILNKERDRFILSKGHAALALYVTLFLKNYITKEEIESYAKNGSCLAVHPKQEVKGVEFSTGSLGQGITFANGYALSAKIENSNRKTYCLISDGEINEGSCWEAFMFIIQHNLNNLIIIYDNNNLQCLGETKDIINNHNINEKMKTFGFEVIDTEGHNHNNLKNLFKEIEIKIDSNKNQKPIFINAKTIAGKGISFMENKLEWHYKTLTEEIFNRAIIELNRN